MVNVEKIDLGKSNKTKILGLIRSMKVNVSPLSKEEDELFNKLLRSTSDFSKPIPFKDDFFIYVGVVPDDVSTRIREFEKREGSEQMLVFPLILLNKKWVSVMVNVDLKELVILLAGNVIAVVGQLKDKRVSNVDGSEKIFYTIKYIRAIKQIDLEV